MTLQTVAFLLQINSTTHPNSRYQSNYHVHVHNLFLIFYSKIMRSSLYHFWGQIIQCPANSLSPITRCMNTPSEIGYLDNLITI